MCVCASIAGGRTSTTSSCKGTTATGGRRRKASSNQQKHALEQPHALWEERAGECVQYKGYAQREKEREDISIRIFAFITA